jgi:hypothetical protein
MSEAKPHERKSASPGKGIGITMALLGVMLAFCAAMVGAARTDLIATMVQQSNHFGVYQAETMKFRVMQSDVEMLRAVTPTRSEVARFQERMQGIKRVSGIADDEDTGELKAAIALSSVELAEVLTPDPEDEAHLRNLQNRYGHDSGEAREDADCYDAKIAAYAGGAEMYERAQLAAEIGIVVASVALLLGSRGAWAVSVVFGLGGALLVGRTVVHTSSLLTAADRKIEEAQKRAVFVEDDDGDGKPDSPGAAPAPAPAPAASGQR